MTIDLRPTMRGLGLCALAAVLTTFLNTIAPHFYSASDFDTAMRLIEHPVYQARQWVLLAHPGFTLMLALGMALALFHRTPGRAGAGLLFATVEKMTEFALGVMILFAVNPEWKGGYLQALGTAEAAGFRLRIEVFNQLLNSLYPLLWIMFILSTMAFATALQREIKRERWLFWSAVAISALTALMLLGDLMSLEWTQPIIRYGYAPTITFHRLLVALWLLSLANGERQPT